jgi:hypothetical protein
MTILQKTITGSVIYSHFRYLCPYHTWLLFNVGLPEVIPAPSDRLLMESGIKHEEEALRYFQREYGDGCAVIRGEEGLSEEENISIRFERTLAAMCEGEPIIFLPVMAHYRISQFGVLRQWAKTNPGCKGEKAPDHSHASG